METLDTVTSAASTWNLVDLGLLLGLAISVLVGIWRGLVTELMALLGWVVAYLAAQFLGADVGRHVPVGEIGSRTNVVAGMAIAFMLTWITWAILTWGITQILKASGLGGADRLLGAVFGLMRGLIVALALSSFVSMTPLAQAESWRASRGVGWLDAALQGLRPILPPEVVQFLPTPPIP
ncbi:MAG: CvpA family protein [Burkholderiales bacterium]|nr:CvpA family protein [Burkholderiales bacterium]MBH2017064.1 CvpA family protein [Burkholderiales bacterium]